jgi:putative oxidoreductase
MSLNFGDRWPINRCQLDPVS